jgi:hypothetical protein
MILPNEKALLAELESDPVAPEGEQVADEGHPDAVHPPVDVVQKLKAEELGSQESDL